MTGDLPIDIPPLAAKAQAIADRGQWRLSSEPRTGALLRTLAASKPGGRILEVGAGLGVGSAWLLAGMDPDARLIGLEVHAKVAGICRDVLAADPRAEIITTNATTWLEEYDGPPFDLVFVDTTEAKFHRRDVVFKNLADGALFVADDLLPNDTWTADHPARVERFRKEILTEPDLVVTMLDWASGLVVGTYRKRRG
ncbi:class I SAM-dependent methyltransferase [Plantactinospora sp. B24E8]|uniref:O-methyltransferase n=1 Tax=Plantactinospora sp. B24E8 TaxID=3153567 RepID=UPI00325D5EE3